MNEKSEMIGQRFGKLVVKSLAGTSKDNRLMYLCICDCGKEIIVIGKNLRSGNSESCGCGRKRPVKDNLTGKRFGKIVVLGLHPEKSPNGKTQYFCRCDCGVERVMLANNLKSGMTESCGFCPNVLDITGKVFNGILVMRMLRIHESRRGLTAECLCHCGKVFFTQAQNIRNGSTKSCGCISGELQASKIRTHGLSYHELYRTWYDIIQRCYNPNWDEVYKNYGAKGVTVYEPWRESPAPFILWIEKNLGHRPEGYSLDRIIPTGNYEPGNLRWADAKTQANNTRKKYLQSLENSQD